MFTKEELIELKNTQGSLLRGYEAIQTMSPAFWTPFFKPNANPNDAYFKVVAKRVTITKTSENAPHTTLIAFDGEKWYLGCGNHFLDGQMTNGDALVLAARLADNAVEHDEMMDAWHSCETNTPCNHWRAWASNNDVCKHSKHLLAFLADDHLREIENHFFASNRVAAVQSDEELIASRMNTYAFKRHLMFVGEKGSGKTHNIYAFLKERKLPHVFVGGTGDTEAIDLKGKLLPYENNGDKNFIWVDGPLTQAFRRAASGEQIVLFIDEALRMAPTGRDVLIPSLATDIDDCYVLDTGRVIEVVDGVGKTECIRAPRENLWVLATTNIGAGYNVEDIESAFEDRFEWIEQNNDTEKMKRILTEIESVKGFNGVAEKLMDFYEKMIELKKNDVLTKLINLRHLSQALWDCDKQADLFDRLMDRMPKWVERDMDGRLIEAQTQAIENALNRVGV